MNNKGFTTIELVLTMVLVLIIMATITNVTYAYRDRSEYEKTLTELTDYKNTLTKIIYDDILDTSNPIVSISKTSSDNNRSYNLRRRNGSVVSLFIKDDDSYPRSAGIVYDNVTYNIPGTESDLITLDIANISYYFDDTNGVYSMDIVFYHRNLEEVFKIHFAVT